VRAEAADIAADVKEIVLDVVLEERLLRDIPMFDWLANSYIDRIPITDLQRPPPCK
jgi:hypothetical protein